MRLTVPGPSFEFETNDIYGEPIRLRDYGGKGVLLCFLRDAACPFCNFRLYELTRKYSAWNKAGLEVIAVFSDSSKQVREHAARHPRPFRMISDPNLEIYQQYGVEQSASALLRAILFKTPRIWKGFKTGARPSKNPHVKIVPADFLIDTNGNLIEAWYGSDTADHIPLRKIQSYVDELSRRGVASVEKQLGKLQAENRKLKKALILLNRRLRNARPADAEPDQASSSKSSRDTLGRSVESHLTH